MTLENYRDVDGKLVAYVWPGGYPLYYMDARGYPLCPQCANLDYVTEYSPEDRPEFAAINWVDCDLICDHCAAQIEAAYSDD